MKKTNGRLFLFLILCVFATGSFANNSGKQSLTQAYENPSPIASMTVLPTASSNLLSKLLPAGYVFQDTPCAPLGDPLEEEAKKYRGYNTFYLCKEQIFHSPAWGASAELYITCRPSTHRKGTKWHIWCNSNGSRCGCNREDFNSGERSCCQWSAGDHCTNDGASPGHNRCAAW